RLARSFGAQRIVLGWHGVGLHLHAAHHVGTRHRIVEEARRQELAALAVPDHLLAQDLTHALRHAAMNLPLEADWVHHRTDIVDHGVAVEPDLARVWIDFDFADMAAVGIGVLL